MFLVACFLLVVQCCLLCRVVCCCLAQIRRAIWRPETPPRLADAFVAGFVDGFLYPGFLQNPAQIRRAFRVTVVENGESKKSVANPSQIRPKSVRQSVLSFPARNRIPNPIPVARPCAPGSMHRARPMALTSKLHYQRPDKWAPVTQHSYCLTLQI